MLKRFILNLQNMASQHEFDLVNTGRRYRPAQPILRTRYYSYPKYVEPYYIDLINAYKKGHFEFFFKQLRSNRHIGIHRKKLVKLLKEELKIKSSMASFKVFLSIHCLILNKLALPDVYNHILANYKILSFLFDADFQYDFSSFCFLMKSIAVDVISEICDECPDKKKKELLLAMLTKRCDNFKFRSRMSEETPFTHFCFIAACLAVGIEILPKNIYYCLKTFFDQMVDFVSGNNCFSHCISKIWDELMLFCEHWIKYSLSYPFLEHLNPSLSKVDFKECVEPDLCIFSNSYIRNKMRYEYVHVKGAYVPCEYPFLPNFPRFPLSDDPDLWFLYNKQADYSRADILGKGFCKECNKSKCSCVRTSMETKEVIIVELSSEPDLEIDKAENISLVCQNNFSHSEAPQLWFDFSDNMDIEEIYHHYDSYVKYNISYSFEKPELQGSFEELTFRRHSKRIGTKKKRQKHWQRSLHKVKKIKT